MGVHLLKEDWPDVMIDLETTGTRVDQNAVLQIAAVRFDLFTGDIDHEDMFCESLLMPPWRCWDEDTREWWARQPETYVNIMETAQPFQEVMQRFIQWYGRSKAIAWSKPKRFDLKFLESMFKDIGAPVPWNYWDAKDLRTWIGARYFPQAARIRQQDIQNDGAHDALMDVIHQIAWLFAVKEDTKMLQPEITELKRWFARVEGIHDEGAFEMYQPGFHPQDKGFIGMNFLADTLKRRDRGNEEGEFTVVLKDTRDFKLYELKYERMVFRHAASESDQPTIQTEFRGMSESPLETPIHGS